MIYTLGHSNHSRERFFQLLTQICCDMVIDVRSQPYSRYVAQYNKAEIERYLVANGIQYMFRGKELGGKPKLKEFYDENGQVDYDKIAVTAIFRSALADLSERWNRGGKLVLMCAEENPVKCHRHVLLSRHLANKYGIAVGHIRGDGTIQPAAKLFGPVRPQQLGLFA